MAIWSFTAERLAKLMEQIAKKKEEHDDLLALSEKDLWCTDLDNFEEEWDRQARLDAEIQTNINRMGRRVSKKIGAGRGRKAAAREDDDYDPGAAKKGKAKAKAAPKVETKSHQRFAEMFSAKPKPKPKDEDEDDVKSEFSDDDIAAFTAKSAPKKSESVEPSEILSRGGKRAAAAKPKTWIVDDDSDSDGENMLGDIDNMVKGIGKQPEASSSKGRVSLFSMSQGGAGKDLPKAKAKKTFDFSDDDTNYEMLAKSSPRKSIKGDDDIDQFLSDEGFQPPVAKAATAKAPAPKAPKPVAPAKRGRPAAASKAKPEKKKEVLSPAAKAYAKKATKPAKPVSEDEEEESIAPRRPARTARAAAAKAKPKYFDSDEEEEDDSFQGGGDDSDDPFGMDSD